jgi:hypothetical protein
METGQWRNMVQALSARPVPGRNMQEQLDITMQDKKKLADLAMVGLCACALAQVLFACV